MKTIVFIPSLDTKKARNFYENILGFTFDTEDQFAVSLNAHGVKVRITKLESFIPAQFTVLGWEVADIKKEMFALKNAGIFFERYPWMNATGLEIWTSPNGNKIAWFKDTDGNLLSLTEI